MKLFLRLFLLCSITLLSITSYSWNAVGHMVVSEIAYQRLTPIVKAKVDKMVLNFSKEYPELGSFNLMSIWPDVVRGQKVEIFTHWHYTDHAFSDDNSPLPNLIDSDNSVWAMGQIESILKYPDGNAFEQARFLAFLVHITGDIHQPLHNVARVTVANPNGDKGGNLFLVQALNDPSRLIPLHKLWDEGLGLFDVEASDVNVRKMATLIVNEYPEAYFSRELEVLLPEQWSLEGVETAKKYVYNTPENELPSEKYLVEGREIAKQKVALAGYRLAAELNLLLG